MKLYQTAAPQRFYAEVTFAVMKTEDGYVPFSSDMTIIGSELFNLVYDNIYPLVSNIFPDSTIAFNTLKQHIRTTLWVEEANTLG